MTKKIFLLLLSMAAAGFIFLICWVSLAGADDCYVSPYSYEEWRAKEDALSEDIIELKKYNLCMIPCWTAVNELTAFKQKYAEVPIGCDVAPCCTKSAQKKDPNCTANLRAMEAKKNQLCSACVLPDKFIDKGPYGDRKIWEEVGMTIEQYIKSQENYLNEKITPIVDKLEQTCSGAAKQETVGQQQENKEESPKDVDSQQKSGPAVSGESKTASTPSKSDIKNEISKVENIGEKLLWQETGEVQEEESTDDLPGKGKIAYMFVQPNLGPIEELFLSGKIAAWEKKFKEMGYEVRKLPWTTDYAKMAFGDPKMGAFDYYGHNGLDTQGSWLEKLSFKYTKKTPAIYGYDADVLKEIIFQAKYEFYLKTMSPAEAQERALKERDNLGLDIANVHACYSADDNSLMDLFVKEGGEFNGNNGTYYAIGDLNVNKIRQ